MIFGKSLKMTFGVVTALTVALVLLSCAPRTVEVTREVPVEVTRLVEVTREAPVEVTRLVEVTKE
ncbi:MAG TPA: hypothetical protein EYP49_13400, partial [Anaerolineae bacterium]|nr:hypothetical protein [Anaerolineae bacterium]